MKKVFIIIILTSIFCLNNTKAAYLLLPMDETQTNHLKAYGITFWTLQNNIEAWWLLNYRGGSFLTPYYADIENECKIRNVKYEVIADVQKNNIFSQISRTDQNMDVVKLEKAPKIAVYSPPNKQPWDDAVTLCLTYAEIPYETIYDQEIINGDLNKYDWLHLHHEDFTGQYGKFYANYRNMPWYRQQQSDAENMAAQNGFTKVSQLKLFIAKTIKTYISNGGFLFAMCSATDTFEIALASEGTDICESMYDGDPSSADCQEKLDFSKTLAFQNFTLERNPMKYEHSNIDVSLDRKVKETEDYFNLFEFSAKWDPVPTMLCQNHNNLIKGFMGQSTAYNNKLIKPDVLIMGQNKSFGEARYIHGNFGKGMWTFLGGHDPEDYRHYVGDPKTELNLYPNSSGYRLILNNVLFPAAKKKKLKT